jgi:hypothetical protein
MTPLHPAPTLPNPLPNFDRRLLHTVERIVPPAERSEWSRTWHAELWHMHHRAGMRRARSRAQNLAVISDLSIGLTRDALWLRTESWRRALSGTPTLCLASLAALCLLSLVLDLALTGSWHTLRPHLAAELRRCFFAAPLVLFVTFATASRRHIERNPIERGRTKRSHASRHIYRLKRQLFSIAKTALVLLLSFQLGADICEPFHALFPNTADVVQIFLFVIIALIGLRWAARDREQRCEQCLHALASPARVGRPSHNLLEWNGTEQACKHGHGLLSVPEMESSWRRSSQWIDSGKTIKRIDPSRRAPTPATT